MHSAQHSGCIGTDTLSPLCPAEDLPKQYLVTDWSHSVLVGQNLDFRDLSRIYSDKETNRLVVGSEPSSFCKEGFPKSFQLGSVPCRPEFPSINKHNIENNLKGKKRKNSNECGATNHHSPVSITNVDVGQQKEAPPVIVNNSTEKNEKKQKNELNPCATTDMLTISNGKKFSPEDGVMKGDNENVRAKRGQSTSSHSLAERVRRERINERMRLLQDLVPGCNKVAGKAVMLDEIINYVQSLQCQVEFLAMKLATVNPELNVDLEQILSKEMLHSRGQPSSIVTISPGASGYHYQLYGSSLQEAMKPDKMCCVPTSSDMPYVPVPHVSYTDQLSSVWDEELLNIAQMSHVPDAMAPSRTVQ